MEGLRIPITGKGDDAVLAESMAAEIERLANLAILKKQVGLAGKRAWRGILPKVESWLARAFAGWLAARRRRLCACA